MHSDLFPFPYKTIPFLSQNKRKYFFCLTWRSVQHVSRLWDDKFTKSLWRNFLHAFTKNGFKTLSALVVLLGVFYAVLQYFQAHVFYFIFKGKLMTMIVNACRQVALKFLSNALPSWVFSSSFVSVDEVLI